jgi:hypothetical protein
LRSKRPKRQENSVCRQVSDQNSQNSAVWSTKVNLCHRIMLVNSSKFCHTLLNGSLHDTIFRFFDICKFCGTINLGNERCNPPATFHLQCLQLQVGMCVKKKKSTRQ